MTIINRRRGDCVVEGSGWRLSLTFLKKSFKALFRVKTHGAVAVDDSLSVAARHESLSWTTTFLLHVLFLQLMEGVYMIIRV